VETVPLFGSSGEVSLGAMANLTGFPPERKGMGKKTGMRSRELPLVSSFDFDFSDFNFI